MFLTYLSMAIADHVGTPELVRYVFSPGYMIAMRFATGNGLLGSLESFGRIAFTVNIVYFGFLSFLVVAQARLAEATAKSTPSVLDGALIPRTF